MRDPCRMRNLPHTFDRPNEPYGPSEIDLTATGFAGRLEGLPWPLSRGS